MEQKKTLWIIAAVSLFLLVVMGAAIIFYNPTLGASKKIASINPVEKTTTTQSGWTNSSSQTQATSSPQVNDMFVVSENTTVLGFNQPAQQTAEDTQSTTIDLNALKKELAAEAAISQPQNINITVNLSEKENEAKVEEAPLVVTSSYYVKDTKNAEQAEKAEKASAVKQTQSTTVAKTESPKQLLLQRLNQLRLQLLLQRKQKLKLRPLPASGYRLQHIAIKRQQKMHVRYCLRKRLIQTSTPTKITNLSCSTECALDRSLQKAKLNTGSQKSQRLVILQKPAAT